MSYLKFVFTITEDHQEHLIAELMDLGFYGFEQFDNELIAYVEKQKSNDSTRQHIEQLMTLFPGCNYQEMDEIEEQNWNAGWEKTIQPQQIGRFLVKPTWSEIQPEDNKLLLEIDPKMAFGTGYHATTRLMLRQLSEADVEHKTVMDAGTGTGILAIASIKLGAKHAIGFDVDPWSKQNATENCFLNNVNDQIEIRFGGTEKIQKTERFNVVLANINRNVILEILEFLSDKTEPGGEIIITGLLDTDETVIRNALEKILIEIVDLKQEDEWILFHLKRKNI